MIVFAAIVKNECPYLLEWVAYHRVVGVDHFIIMDNESDDGTALLLDALDALGIVTSFRWETQLRYPHFPDAAIGPQIPAYELALRYAREIGRWRWIGMIDLDEFVVPETAPNLAEMLLDFENHAALGLNWKLYGSSGHEQPPAGLVMENFIYRAPDLFAPNAHVKTIMRIDCVRQPGIHIPLLLEGSLVDVEGFEIPRQRDGVHDRISFNRGWINHYFTKSHVEWQRKRARGRATKSVSDQERIRSESMFAEYDRNEIIDAQVWRFLPEVKLEMARLAALIEALPIRLPGGLR